MTDSLALLTLMTVGGVWKMWSFFKLGAVQRRFPVSYLLFLAFFVILSVPVLAEPIQAWDSRSIWFYHAKAIYFHNSLRLDGQWTSLVHSFSHLDYPKLFPLLAASCAAYFGYWNEFLPKFAAVLVIAPILLFVFEYSKPDDVATGRLGWRWFSQWACGYVLLLLMLFFFDSSGLLFVTGYLDGTVAMYAACAALTAVKICSGISSGEPIERSCIEREGTKLILLLAVLSQLKQEGLVVAGLIVGVTAIAALLIHGAIHGWKFAVGRGVSTGSSHSKKRLGLGMWGTAGLSAITVALYFQMNSSQRLTSLHYAGGAIERMLERFQDGVSFQWILSNLVFHNSMVLGALCLLLVLVLHSLLRKYFQPVLLLPAVIAGIYAGVLLMTYLATSADLNWHMACSAGRVGTTTALLLLASCYAIIRARMLSALKN